MDPAGKYLLRYFAALIKASLAELIYAIKTCDLAALVESNVC